MNEVIEEITLPKQPTPWSCYPTCVSFLTGIPFDDLIKTIGHDGSKIVDQSAVDPWGREAFCHTQVALALLKKGWASIELQASPQHSNGDGVTGYPSWDRLQSIVAKRCDRVLLIAQKPSEGLHCYAWRPSENLTLDPLAGEEIEAVPYPVMYIELLVPILNPS